LAYLNPAAICAPPEAAPRTLEEAEIAHIRKILDEEDWNISHASKVLAVDRSTLHKKIRKYGLER
jgi:transcriptional regulator of acetoin/glycerol metabolism